MTVTTKQKHYLRELSSLYQYRVTDPDGEVGMLTGVLFEPFSWRVSRLIVDPDAGVDRHVFVPVREIRSISEQACRIDVDHAGTRPYLSRHEVEAAVSEAGLASSDDLVGHDIQGLDGNAGRVADLLVNVDVWQLRYLVISAGAGAALTDIEWCVSIGGGDASPRIDLPAAAIATAPRYGGLDELCIGYEEALYRHYTQRAYVGTDSVA
jgi:sporulation protein YlmC with PRC-barrel domain